MLRNTRKRTIRLLKAVMGITMSVAMICTNLACAFAREDEYPYSSSFPSGIEDADISVFTERQINYPLNTNFETNEEVDFVKSNSQNGQITLTEDSYEGKFALGIKPLTNDKILIKNTEYFTVGENISSVVSYGLRSNSEDDIGIYVEDKEITIIGVADPNKEITLLVLTATKK